MANSILHSFIPVTVQIQNFRSVRLTYAFTIVGTIMSFFVLHAILETTTRMTWSFARDNGLMGSKHLAKVHEKFQIPVWALVSSSGLLAICGCIYMASSTGKTDPAEKPLCLFPPQRHTCVFMFR